MMALKLRLLFSTSNCSAKNVELSPHYQGTDSTEESEGVSLGVRRIPYGQKLVQVRCYPESLRLRWGAQAF